MKKNRAYFLHRKRFSYWLFGFLMCLGISATAQQEIVGTVTDNTQLPLPGVAVFVKGSTVGTTTDFDGNYTITVPEDATILSFSSIGFKDKDEAISGRTTINVELEVSNESLEETVVIGYGARRKQDLTGSVAIVNKEDITAFPAQTVAQTLQGRASGVQIQSGNAGEPGAPIRVRVRGGTSISESSNPLFVVDGFVGGAQPAPEDIASIQILKDASSTAIYGSRGANGVIIITTKKGATGDVKVEVNTSYSINEATNLIEVLNADEYENYRNDVNLVNSDDSGDPFSPYVRLGDSNTDWQDYIFRSGSISNNQISISGGSDSSRFYASASHFNQEGTIIGSGADRLSLTGNLNVDVNDKVKVGLNVIARRANTNSVVNQSGSSSRDLGVVTTALTIDPSLGIGQRNEAGNFVSDAEIESPFVVLNEVDIETKNDDFQSNAFAEFQLFKGLSFKSTLGYRVRNRRFGRFRSGLTREGERPARGTEVEGSANGAARLEYRKQTDIITEHYLTYKKEFSNSKLTTTAGYSYNRFDDERVRVDGNNFPEDNLGFEGIQNAGVFNANTFGSSNRPAFNERELASYFGRINFDLADKYLFTASMRADGASTFPTDNKWGYFPSGAFAWNMGNEAFLENVDAISNWKWRVSYGLTGNSSGQVASTQSTVSVDPNNGSVSIGSLASPELTWETSKQWNFGVDFGLFNNRVNVTADYYDILTEDVIVNILPPAITGSTIPRPLNSGEISNKGFEFQISTKNLEGDFNWSTDFNISANRTRVESLPNNNADIPRVGPGISAAPGSIFTGNTTALNILRVGETPGAFYGVKYLGVAQVGNEQGVAPGTALYGDEEEIIGDPNPDFIAGLNNTFTYKGFDLNIFFQGSFGNDIYNITALELNSLTGQNNTTRDAYFNAWTPANPNTNVPAAGRDTRGVSSDRFVEDGSYVRLKNVALGYNFDKELINKLKLSKLRLFISGQNLLTFTNYSGYDPETSFGSTNPDGSSSSERSNLNVGLDYGGYPNFVAFTMGLNVGF